MFPERIETDRLVLEALTHETVDLFEFYGHCSTGAPHIDEVTEHLTWDPHRTPKETKDFVEAREQARADAEGSEYVIRPKDGEDGAGEIAGMTGIDVDWDRRTATFGTWLRKRFWGRGYSGERAAALMDVAFDRLDLEVVVVDHFAGNEKSRRAIEKYVERFGGDHDGLLRNWYPAGDEVRDVHRYSITREQWRANR
ncbi:GNAT family N-acetyltransferase [Halomicrococcus gelatinilyticus]|uniref:GNAT family N-acetyltransferase n=1 Tax=Halomicrococcus gelatinilyticus TaxID=1702103 RepID=UPI002E0F5BBB